MPRFIKIAIDEHLPQLGVVTDVTAMQDILLRQFPQLAEKNWRVIGMNVKQFHHRPGRKCDLFYGLYFENTMTGEYYRQILSAVALPKGVAQEQFARAREQGCFQPEVGLAVHFLPELEMILWGFPNDPKLKRLHELVDKATLREILQTHWARLRVPPDFSLIDIDTEVVKYVPQDRCTLKHRLQLQSADRADELILFSKTYSPKTAGEAIFTVMQDLWNAPVSQSGALMVPEPLFYERDINVVFQRGMAGSHVDEQINQIDLEPIAAKIGVALAGLHQSAVPASDYRSREREMAEFVDGMEALGKFNQAYQVPLEAINDELWRSLPNLTPLQTVPTHGAFRLSQLLMGDGKIGLVDFDGFLYGDPILDVSSFVAHLLYLVVKGDMSATQSRAAIRQFCRAYAETASWGLPVDVLKWYVTVMLIGKQARKCIKLAKESHAIKVEQLVEIAAAILAGKESLMD